MISVNPASGADGATEALLGLLLTRAPVNLAIFDREMKYLVYTRAWADQFRIGDRSLVGRFHGEALPGILECWVDGHRRVLQGESFSSDSDIYVDPESSERWVSWEIHPWTDAAGRIGGSILSFQEITRQLGIESKLRREMEAASASSQAKARLLITTSYEVRAAVNSIIGMAHLCLRSDQSEKDSRHLKTIITEATVLTSSFDDILDLCKVETGSLQLECQEFSLGDVLNELAGAIGVAAEAKGVEFVYQLPESPLPAMLGDPARLRQILANLCRNAVDLTERGEVELGIKIFDPEGDVVTIEFSVRDTSPAFTAEDREKLLEPFTPGECAGAGALARTRLGLSVCKGLISLMNGQLWVSSEPDRGNVFAFTAEFTALSQDRAQSDAPPDSLTGSRVLVVDDHRLARKTMARLLKSFGFEVGVAESGDRAIEMAEEACERGRPYHFVFMDYLMPGMNGLETTTQLKKKLRPHGTLKVILMTGRPMGDKMQEMENSQLDGYISKPFTPSLIFYAMLDAARAWPAAGDTKGPDASRGAHPTFSSGTRVLLVEDDPINQEIVQEILGDAGLEIDVANDGKEGVARLQGRRYDAVLMDIQMPVMDGYEATCRIRADDRFADLPIIALTASAMTLDRHASLEVGMNAHVAKPINPAELISVLAEWIEPGDDSGEAGSKGEVGVAEPPASTPFPQFESLDAERGLALMGGNENLFRRVLQKFAVNQAATDREIRAALGMNDHQVARRLVHTLKGLAGNIGAHTLEKSAQGLEAALRRGDSDEYGAHLRCVSAELRRVVEEISGLVQETASTGVGGAEQVRP